MIRSRQALLLPGLARVHRLIFPLESVYYPGNPIKAC